MDPKVSDHLEGKEPVVREIYDKLLKETEKFGSVKTDPNNSSIHLVNRFAFAGIYTRKNYINLEFHLIHDLDSKRISKTEQASANRFHHRVKLENEKEVDKEVISWLKEAYELKK